MHVNLKGLRCSNDSSGIWRVAACSKARKRRKHDIFRICLNLCVSKIHCYGHLNFEGSLLFKWLSGIWQVIACWKALEKASKIDSSLASFEHDMNVAKNANVGSFMCTNGFVLIWWLMCGWLDLYSRRPLAWKGLEFLFIYLVH